MDGYGTTFTNKLAATRFVEALSETSWEADLVTVVVAEVVPRKWWEHLLHNNTALLIKAAFLFRLNVVVTSVPYLLGHAVRLGDLPHHDELLDAEIGTSRLASLA